MAYSFRIDTAQGVVLFKGAEIFSISDILNCLEEIEADPAFKPEFGHLVDMREVTNFEPSSTEIRIRAYRDRGSAKLDASRIAIVASSDLVYAPADFFA